MSESIISASATALPADRDILLAYREWLHYEGRILGGELYPNDENCDGLIFHHDLSTHFHFPKVGSWEDVPKPSTRARTVLEAVGILPKHAATAEELAAIDFEPWVAKTDDWRPPTNKEWNEIGAWVMPIVRMAWLTMFKTKAEVLELVEGMDREEIFEEYMKNLNRAQEALGGFLTVMRSAETRVICAGAILELQDEESD
jgi:hypothetical protein